MDTFHGTEQRLRALHLAMFSTRNHPQCQAGRIHIHSGVNESYTSIVVLSADHKRLTMNLSLGPTHPMDFNINLHVCFPLMVCWARSYLCNLGPCPSRLLCNLRRGCTRAGVSTLFLFKSSQGSILTRLGPSCLSAMLVAYSLFSYGSQLVGERTRGCLWCHALFQPFVSCTRCL